MPSQLTKLQEITRFRMYFGLDMSVLPIPIRMPLRAWVKLVLKPNSRECKSPSGNTTGQPALLRATPSLTYLIHGKTYFLSMSAAQRKIIQNGKGKLVQAPLRTLWWPRCIFHSCWRVPVKGRIGFFQAVATIS